MLSIAVEYTVFWLIILRLLQHQSVLFIAIKILPFKVELRHQTVNRQNVELQSRIEELEENLEEANIKNQRSALNLSTQSITSPGFSSYADELTQLINERNLMRDEISDLQARIATAASEKSGVCRCH